MPIEPPASRWSMPDAPAVDDTGLVGRRRRPRTGNAARRLPRRAVPDAVGRSADRVVLARPAGGRAARRAARQPIAAPQPAAIRRDDRHAVPRGDERCAEPDGDGGGSRPSSSRPTPTARARLGALGRDVAATASWSVASTACASTGSSPANRCSTRHGRVEGGAGALVVGWWRRGRRCSMCSGRHRTSSRSAPSTCRRDEYLTPS